MLICIEHNNYHPIPDVATDRANLFLKPVSDTCLVNHPVYIEYNITILELR